MDPDFFILDSERQNQSEVTEFYLLRVNECEG